MTQSRSDLSYYELRAEAELEQAQAATDPHTVRAHYYLAGYYLDRIHGPFEDPIRMEATNAQQA